MFVCILIVCKVQTANGCAMCIYANSHSNSRSPHSLNRIRRPCSDKEFPPKWSWKCVYRRADTAFVVVIFSAIAIEWIALSNNEFIKLNHPQPKEEKILNVATKCIRTWMNEMALALKSELKAKILKFAGNSSAINEFCRSYARSLSAALTQRTVYLFRLISYQILARY